MTITINYTAFLLTILSGGIIAAIAYFIVVLRRVSKTFARLDNVIDRTDQLLGSLTVLADESTATVVAARQLVDEGQRVVADFTAVSSRMRELAESDASRALSLIERIKSFVAIFAGVKTAFASVKHFMDRRHHAAADKTDN